jgi:FkbM family methyltransferase
MKRQSGLGTNAVTERVSSRPNTRPTPLSQMQRLFQIVFNERRIPGRILKVYYGFLDAIGVHKIEVVTKNGLVIEGLSNSLWMYHETWDKDDYAIPGLKLQSGTTVVDIGANQGFFSLYAASMGARVLAFEPSKSTFETLKKNVDRNKMGGLVSCFNLAVTGASGTADFYEGFDKKGRFISSSPSVIDDNRGGAVVKSTVAQTISLDDLFRNHEIGVCDLLKMDCEGAEYQILAAATNYSFDRIRNIALEFHHGKVNVIEGQLENAGFEILSSVDAESGLVKAKKRMN